MESAYDNSEKKVFNFIFEFLFSAIAIGVQIMKYIDIKNLNYNLQFLIHKMYL